MSSENSSTVASLSPGGNIQDNPSQLLRLPDELLEKILEHAYYVKNFPRRTSDDRNLAHAHEPVCRRLWEIQRPILYRCISIMSVSSLASLARTVIEDGEDNKKRSSGDLIVHLFICSDQRWPPSYDPRLFGNATASYALAGYVSRFFRALTRLESLDMAIRGSDSFGVDGLELALVYAVVMDPTRSVKLATLRNLELRVGSGPYGTSPNSEADPWAAASAASAASRSSPS
ncbi:hypothetical protein JCM9279_004876 [Rhodotorula babjevae]